MSLSIDELKKQLQDYTMQRLTVQRSFEQLNGAIHVVEEQIKLISRKESDAAKIAAEVEGQRLAEEAAKIASNQEAKKQSDLVDMDIAKLDHDIKLDEGVLQNEGQS